MTEPRFITTAEGNRLRCQVFDAASGKTGRGVCVLLHGQTEFIEKYLEVIGELQSRGFTVATLDWPGQGGSYRLLPDALKAHIANFSAYDTALWAFMDQVVNPLGDAQPIILAHSMGGHIALRAMHDRPNAFKCAVLSAPMLRALTRGYPRWLANFMCNVQNWIGKGSDWIWGMDQRDPHIVNFDTQLVTTDRARFQRTQDFLKIHPDLRLAGPTWGWLKQATLSMATMMTPSYAKAITTPVLICAPGQDRIVDVTAEHEFVKWLPNGQLHDMPDSEHEILMESDPVRTDFWAAFDGFVGKFV
ncbi:MAG TPA: alpha/beta hydrolase [Rhizomicrobium sp.]|nr:alpha/beta hydrolase [Rhizomicrobium sp.]